MARSPLKRFNQGFPGLEGRFSQDFGNRFEQGFPGQGQSRPDFGQQQLPPVFGGGQQFPPQLPQPLGLPAFQQQPQGGGIRLGNESPFAQVTPQPQLPPPVLNQQPGGGVRLGGDSPFLQVTPQQPGIGQFEQQQFNQPLGGVLPSPIARGPVPQGLPGGKVVIPPGQTPDIDPNAPIAPPVISGPGSLSPQGFPVRPSPGGLAQQTPGQPFNPFPEGPIIAPPRPPVESPGGPGTLFPSGVTPPFSSPPIIGGPKQGFTPSPFPNDPVITQGEVGGLIGQGGAPNRGDFQEQPNLQQLLGTAFGGGDPFAGLVQQTPQFQAPPQITADQLLGSLNFSQPQPVGPQNNQIPPNIASILQQFRGTEDFGRFRPNRILP